MKILARDIEELHNEKIPWVKILQQNHSLKKAVWESEEVMN